MVRITLTLFSLALVSAVIAYAQATASGEVFSIPVGNSATHSWQDAQQAGPSKGKLIVISFDRRRQTCRIKSFSPDKLVCSRSIGGPRVYLPQQVAALIVPGFDERLRLPLWVGANVGLGAAIWGTVVLAAACPACAVGTGIAALFFFGFAGSLVYGDGQPDRTIYVAPGQQSPDDSEASAP